MHHGVAARVIASVLLAAGITACAPDLRGTPSPQPGHGYLEVGVVNLLGTPVPVGTATVVATPEGTVVGSVPLNEGGAFRLQLAEGTYRVDVIAPGLRPQWSLVAIFANASVGVSIALHPS